MSKWQSATKVVRATKLQHTRPVLRRKQILVGWSAGGERVSESGKEFTQEKAAADAKGGW